MDRWIDANGFDSVEELVYYASGLTERYGGAASALACEMYDEIARASGVSVPAAIPAEGLPVGYVDRAVHRELKKSKITIPSLVSRMVKQAAADTTLQNAARDGAEFAWVPNGDTCAFCITLASNGWRRQGKKAAKGIHASHIHANCDCTYAVRFNTDTSYSGYDPEQYAETYYSADGSNWKDRVNSIRREQYKKDKGEINARKRELYAMQRQSND